VVHAPLFYRPMSPDPWADSICVTHVVRLSVMCADVSTPTSPPPAPPSAPVQLPLTPLALRQRLRPDSARIPTALATRHATDAATCDATCGPTSSDSYLSPAALRPGSAALCACLSQYHDRDSTVDLSPFLPHILCFGHHRFSSHGHS